jgi:AAA domain
MPNETELWPGIKEPVEKPAPKLRVVPPDYPAEAFTAASLASLEPYDWVYKRLLLCRYFTALGAPAGTGKSALIVAIAVSIATGRALLGGAPPERRKVWIINLEDPREAILKLIWACCEHHQVEMVDLEGWLYINSGRNRPLLVATTVKDLVTVMPVVDLLEASCKERDVGVLFVDPVVDSHALPENDNVSMNEFCAIWNGLAERCNMAICLSMHFRKGGLGGDPDSFRGASAIIGKARVAVTLSVMSKEEAEKLSVPEDRRSYHLRLDNAKRNLSPPPTHADWLHLESVQLSIGDNIQAVSEWQPPSPWDGLSMADAVRCLERIDAGPSPGEYYTASARGRTNERWAGNVLVEAGRNPQQAAQILNQWLQSGALVTGLYHSPNTRKELSCVRVNGEKLGEMRASIVAPGVDDWEG